MHEDVAYITSAVADFLNNHNLLNSALCFPYQALRPGFRGTQPFFALYLFPVFYYAAIFKLFGINDLAFYVGQILLTLALTGAVAKSGLGWRGATLLIAASVLTGTLVGSLCFSPSQLFAIVFAAVFWVDLVYHQQSPLVLEGILLGFSLHTRPEAVLIGLACLIKKWWSYRESSAFRRMAPMVISALASFGVLWAIRKALGASSDYDNKSVLLFANVLAPRFNILGLSQLPPLSRLVLDPILFASFCHKLIANIIDSLKPSAFLWGRSDGLLWLLPPFFCVLHIADWKEYKPVALFFAVDVVLNAAQIPLPRHYDIAMFFLIWAISHTLCRWVEGLLPNFGRLIQGVAALLSLLVLTGPLSHVREDFERARRVRQGMLESSLEAHRVVPSDAFVITDLPQLWIWYGRGKMCCLAPFQNSDTLQRLLDRFPEAYMVMFYGDEKMGYPLGPFQRPVLSRAHHVIVYGPAKDRGRQDLPKK